MAAKKRTTRRTKSRARTSRTKVSRARTPRKAKLAKPSEAKELGEIKTVPLMRVEKEPRRETREGTRHREGYMGLSYEAWVNIILLVAIILIIGILAGVGSLVQNVRTAQPEMKIISVPTGNPPTGIGVEKAKERATSVLDIVVGPANYEIESIVTEHGLYRVNLILKTSQGDKKGVAFLTLDGKLLFARPIDIDQLLEMQKQQMSQIQPTNSTA